ncbi:hypothetical protein [Bdellovibrio sp. HCB337]|uniref:hypothetical protein n=1 Tax=Bdellovibrio sp. HCB337 TaxID=3394358 RepID=UPI0039A6F6F2
MKKAFALATLLFCLLSFHQSFAGGYPQGPAKKLTPGQLCANPNSHRYPEGIAYCNRDVSPALKRQIIANYDKSFGYNIEGMDRKNFKIDHYIPLCMGGSNDITNLWPQHVSVYTLTDSLEEALCEKMDLGRILQKDAVILIKKAKNNLNLVAEIKLYVDHL